MAVQLFQVFRFDESNSLSMISNGVKIMILILNRDNK